MGRKERNYIITDNTLRNHIYMVSEARAVLAGGVEESRRDSTERVIFELVCGE